MFKMLKFNKLYSSLTSVDNVLKQVCSNPNINKLNLLASNEQNNRKKHKNKQNWQFRDYFLYSKPFFPVGLSLVLCESFTNSDERRFMHAVQYGIDDEVKRLVFILFVVYLTENTSFRLINNVDVNKRHVFGWTPLMVAAVHGRAAVVKTLLKAGANPNAQDEYSNITKVARERGLHSVEGILFFLL